METVVLRFETIDSTNSAALDYARRGADEGLVIVASEQSAGRGRHGRVWHSAAGDGLYLSIILRPKVPLTDFPLLTLMAGVAAKDALEEFGVSADLKWVNDLLVKGRKIGGILAETAETDRGPAVVVGIGVNLRSRAMPPELAQIATSIETETGKIVSALSLESALIRYLAYFYEIFSAPDGRVQIREEWQKRSTFANGKFVRVKTEEALITGRTDGLEPDGGLRIITESGLMTIRAGDVENLREEGSEISSGVRGD